MIKHTTVDLDITLLEAAQKILGTSQTTETIHRALQEVIAQRKRRWLADYSFPELTPETLEDMRRAGALVNVDELRAF
ncbi:MAG: type II toxin-antitoxin system VapB family antitoxin [Dehalococcoidia bacterium]